MYDHLVGRRRTRRVKVGTDRLKDGARGTEDMRSQPMTLESIGHRWQVPARCGRGEPDTTPTPRDWTYSLVVVLSRYEGLSPPRNAVGCRVTVNMAGPAR
jgi:hypothetical protein